MKEKYRISVDSVARKENMVACGSLRLTLLTPALVRMEWNEKKNFVDMPSQVVWHREFGKVPFEQTRTENGFTVETTNLQIVYTEGKSLEDCISICMKKEDGSYGKMWHFGQRIETLKGTTRTLDMADGRVELEEGILAREGYTILDDSKSYLIRENGELENRISEGLDIYFFGYGHAYTKCLHDYLKLTGMPPLLPRYVFGNWWSRYHRYTQEEYKELISTFEEKKIPLSVAVIDMDWHLTQIDPAIGSGWTGYSWNRDLFPDPTEFMNWLHEHNLKISLNVHPAEGVGCHEEAYAVMAQALGIDPASKKKIDFDVTSPDFMEAYFQYLHEPLEKEGVDFWWVDWQQGEESRLPNLDPLWVLNHYHYLDNGRADKRPLILSRYSGPGSHRYPLGFSGDSIISWESLAFQPYFTATASNIGYGWWSHDIGGHMLGIYDEELQIRWIQFGVFSPICRIHSSASPFNHKEPWNYTKETERIITEYLQLRSKLIPYLYTMNKRFSSTGCPLISPMYYEYPEKEEAYEQPNEYLFGTQLICLPITSPVIKKLQMARVDAWIPDGVYIDWMTGMIYRGNRKLSLYRNIEQLPLLLKAGAILPLDARELGENVDVNPDRLELIIAAGDDGAFTLYEDDGNTFSYQEGNYVKTGFSLDFHKKSQFIIHAAKGNAKLIQQKRYYRLRFLGFEMPTSVVAISNKEELHQELAFIYHKERKEIVVELMVDSAKDVCIQFVSGMRLAANDIVSSCFALLDKAYIDYRRKEEIYDVIKRQEEKSERELLAELEEVVKDVDIMAALRERMVADTESIRE